MKPIEDFYRFCGEQDIAVHPDRWRKVFRPTFKKYSAELAREPEFIHWPQIRAMGK